MYLTNSFSGLQNTRKILLSIKESLPQLRTNLLIWTIAPKFYLYSTSVLLLSLSVSVQSLSHTSKSIALAFFQHIGMDTVTFRTIAVY